MHWHSRRSIPIIYCTLGCTCSCTLYNCFSIWLTILFINNSLITWMIPNFTSTKTCSSSHFSTCLPRTQNTTSRITNWWTNYITICKPSSTSWWTWAIWLRSGTITVICRRARLAFSINNCSTITPTSTLSFRRTTIRRWSTILSRTTPCPWTTSCHSWWITSSTEVGSRSSRKCPLIRWTTLSIYRRRRCSRTDTFPWFFTLKWWIFTISLPTSFSWSIRLYFPINRWITWIRRWFS